jgi:hypothetical protein
MSPTVDHLCDACHLKGWEHVNQVWLTLEKNCHVTKGTITRAKLDALIQEALEKYSRLRWLQYSLFI